MKRIFILLCFLSAISGLAQYESGRSLPFLVSPPQTSLATGGQPLFQPAVTPITQTGSAITANALNQGLNSVLQSVDLDTDEVAAAMPIISEGLAALSSLAQLAQAAQNTGVSLTEGISGAKGTYYFGGYDPETGITYLGSDGHFGGMQAAGGTPLPATTPGITVLQTPTGITWANDSLSLPAALTPAQAAEVQSALQAQFPGTVVIQVPVVK